MDLNCILRREEIDVIYFLMERGILEALKKCKCCGFDLKLCVTRRNKEGVAWRCSNNICSMYNVWVSTRENSFFENTTASLKEYLKALYFWGSGAKLSDIKKHCVLSKSVLIKLKNMLAEKIKKHFACNTIMLGGLGKIVQIDETMLNHKAKAHRGRFPVLQTWALGMVDCSTAPGKGLFVLIPDKSAKSILPLINKHVRPGTIIYTDEAKVYKKLSEEKTFEHKFVTHKYCFVDYKKNVHTQNVESFNNKLKLKIKESKGVIRGKHEDFLNLFTWHDIHGNNCVEETLKLIKL